MGACTFVNEATAPSANIAYNQLCEDAIEYYGEREGYNGTISTTSGFTIIKAYDKYSDSKQRRKEVSSLIQKSYDHCSKWGKCNCIDLGTVYYERVTVAEKRKKTDAKFAQKYVIEIMDGFDWKDGKTANTKGELKAEVNKLINKGETCRIVKKPVLVSGSTVSSEFVVETKRFNTMPKKVKGTIAIKEYHKYVFAGWGAC